MQGDRVQLECLLLPSEVCACIQSHTFFLGKYYCLYFLAPSSSPINITFNTTSTSITVKWIYDTSDADGYIVYYDGTAKQVVGGGVKETILDGLMPGTRYSISVRAYQDILGPPGTISASTDDGKNCCICIAVLWYLTL